MSRRGQRGRVRPREDGWDQWGGYMNAKRQKLKEQFDKEAPQQLKKEASGSKIFNGVTIHVNGYTKPSSDELKRLMMLHGGAYEHYLYRTRVSHVIATNLPDSKVRELKGLKVVRPEWITDRTRVSHVIATNLPESKVRELKGLKVVRPEWITERTRVSHVIATNLPDSKVRELKGLKVVRPEWITESIAAGRLLNYSNYLLYTSKSGLQTGLRGLVTKQHSNESTVSESRTSLQSETSIGTNGDSFNAATNGSMPVTNTVNQQQNGSDISEQSIIHKQNSTPPRKLSNGGSMNGHAHVSMSNTSPAKAGDPNFLNEFYSNSRLHYLSTWKAEFKSYVNELQKEGGTFPGRERLRKHVQENDVCRDDDDVYTGKSGKPKRCVMHVDMDCFFVSVGLRNRPDLKGKPVAVTHSKGKGASIDSESDMFYEAMQWEKRRMNGGKKGKKTDQQHQHNNTSTEHDFPDKSDSESENDVNTPDITGPTTESFHSFAEIASCSYEARQRGVKNGMFMGKAKTICPELVTIPYNFEQYKTVSKILYDTVASYSHDIEAVSCDEMLVDCTELLVNTGASPDQFAAMLRQEIHDKTGCCASAGLASNVLLAKMATRKAKPNGQYYLPDRDVPEFIKPQSVKDIPGVGWSLTRRFEAMKVMTCGDLQTVAMDTLQKEFGPKTGQSLYRYCRGQDDRPVKIEQQRKSVSAEVNYGIRFNSDREAHKFIQELSEEVCSRLQNIAMKGKTVTLKLMIRREDAPKATSKFMGHGICNNFSKSVTLPLATDNSAVIGQECLSILKQQKCVASDLRGDSTEILKHKEKMLSLLKQQKCVASDLRGIGIQIHKLEPAVVGTAANLSKNQSILNFTVNKNNNKTTSSTMNNGAAFKWDHSKNAQWKEKLHIGAFQRKPCNCSLKQAAVLRFSLKSDNILLLWHSSLFQIGIQIHKLESAVVGTTANLSKNQSILNFTVNKNNNKTTSSTDNNQRFNQTTEKKENNQLLNQTTEKNENRTAKWICDTQVKGYNAQTFCDKTINGGKSDINGSFHCNRNGSDNAIPPGCQNIEIPCDNKGIKPDNPYNKTQNNANAKVGENSSQISKALNNSDSSKDSNDPDFSELACDERQASINGEDIEVDHDDTRQMTDVDSYCRESQDIVVGQVDAQSSELLQDLGQRQVLSSQLPPLPCFPDIQSPSSSQSNDVNIDINTPTSGHAQSTDIDVNTPVSRTKHLRERRPSAQEDYFPSPSQIDPEVLKELPQDIRVQVEREIENRRKSTRRRPSSSQGCSHWQSTGEGSFSASQNKGNNSSVSQNKGDNLSALQNKGYHSSVLQNNGDNSSISQNKGSNSSDTSQTRGDNSDSSTTTRSTIESDIVPLPSSSQLDLSCLNALPESLQAEIRQAYAIQGQTTIGNNAGPTMMNLRQAKSPHKSPRKRSPAKTSPQFKVPKGRPTSRGRKKGSSKKLVFKDQPRIGGTITIEDKGRNAVRNEEETITIDNETLHIPKPNIEVQTDVTIDQVDEISTTVEVCANTVNLCGAVKIGDVRNLIREWVSSTQVPQTEDEEVILEYIHDLVKDKNLEQVDLVLKSMLRNINRIENGDWFSTLRRILSQTQGIVKQYYGHSLCSISL